jgi:hypothetical protein
MASPVAGRFHVIGTIACVQILVTASGAMAQPDPPGPTSRFVSDVAHDYREFLSWDSLQWLSIGGVISLAVSEADEALRVKTEEPTATLTRTLEAGGTGATYGNIGLQLPLAIVWWRVADATGHQRGAMAGRDLVRAQISALSWTYVFKYAADRTRPNGDPRSFPSGHASAAFATAMVLHRHYGWKAGVPAFVAATLTAGSRITVNKHWASDVTFGAVVGMVAARTAIRVRDTPLTVAPMRFYGGAGIRFTAVY